MCLIAGLSGSAEKTLTSIGVLRKIATENILPTRAAAIAKAAGHISELKK